METLILIQKLTECLSLIIKDDFINCNMTIAGNTISLVDWKHGMVTNVALMHLLDYVNKCGLHLYVDLEDSKLTIHG